MKGKKKINSSKFWPNTKKYLFEITFSIQIFQDQTKQKMSQENGSRSIYLGSDGYWNRNRRENSEDALPLLNTPLKKFYS